MECNRSIVQQNNHVKSILNILSTHIKIIQCENNKKVYISKECPFCGEKGKRVFRYNTKLKVGKSFCCGNSFKEIHWLKKQLIDKDFARKFQLINRHKIYKNISDNLYRELLKDKVGMKKSSFEKSKKVDDNLPF